MVGNALAHAYSAVVLQASGMVAIQANCTPNEALDLMSGRVEVKACCRLDEYALAIVERRTRYL